MQHNFKDLFTSLSHLVRLRSADPYHLTVCSYEDTHPLPTSTQPRHKYNGTIPLRNYFLKVTRQKSLGCMYIFSCGRPSPTHSTSIPPQHLCVNAHYYGSSYNPPILRFDPYNSPHPRPPHYRKELSPPSHIHTI